MSKIEDLTNRSAQIRSKLRELLDRRHHSAADKRKFWLVGSVDIAFEHHEAIERLVRSKLFGSAFALVRIVYDTAYRVLWIHGVANDEQVEQAMRDELKWRKIQVRADVRRSTLAALTTQREVEAFEILFQRLDEAWEAMCSYTHSGWLQIQRRFTDAELKPNYSEGDILQALNLANVVLLVFVMIFFANEECDAEGSETMGMLIEYSADWREQLKSP